MKPTSPKTDREPVARYRRSPLYTREFLDYAVEQYAWHLVNRLGTIYTNLRAGLPLFMPWPVPTRYTNLGMIAQPFFFGAEPSVRWTAPLIRQNLSRGIKAHKNVFYQGNVILVAKPDELNYWTGKQAQDDSRKILDDLVNMGWGGRGFPRKARP